jgi:methylmalonyl-CoA mutase N-terminal domain/subunit
MSHATTHNITGPNLDNIDPHAVTISGIVLDPSYTPGNLPVSLQNFDRDINDPGKFPFTRGLVPKGYLSRLWTMRQFAGFGSADDTNQRFKYLLEAAKTSTKANTGLSTAFDLPTLMGRDSDDMLSIGEVGKCGVAIDTIEDMHRLYADIPIDKVTVSQTINGQATQHRMGHARRHTPERHPQRVPRTERVHLPAGSIRQARRGHHRVPVTTPPQMELRLHLRLPHP